MIFFFFLVIYGKYGYLIILLINTLVWIYIDRKSKAFDKFIEFKTNLDNLLGKHIKTLQLDRGNVSSRFDPFHREHEMIS